MENNSLVFVKIGILFNIVNAEISSNAVFCCVDLF